MDSLETYLVPLILLFFGGMEVLSGYWHRSKRDGSDWIQEFGSFMVLVLFTKPGIVLLVGFLGALWFPALPNAFAEANFWLVFFGFLFVDDLLQYWYHRLAHETPWLWKLHRAHHRAEEMGFFVSYRNAALYYVLMPNIWWIAIVNLLGGGLPVSVAIVLKQVIVIGSHSTTRWDQYLYKYKWLNPLASFVERLIITPAFHFAHHGKSMQDGISDPNGNYGNMFSIWDQLFGTATFTRQYPEEFGLINDPEDHWTTNMLYPIVRSAKPHSELSPQYERGDTTLPVPTILHLEAGKKYLYCQCGYSRTQPFCDGSHQGSKFKPIVFSVKRDKKVKLCNCKLSKAGPFCDGSHIEMEQDTCDQF